MADLAPAKSKAQRALAKTLEFYDAAAARSALAKGARVDSAHGERVGILMRASALGACDAKYLALLAASSGADSRDSYGRTALHHAAAAGRPANLKILLEAGLDPEALDHQGLTPFATALSTGQGSWPCAFLLESEHSLMANDAMGRRGLHVAQEAFARSIQSAHFALAAEQIHMAEKLLMRGFALVEILDMQSGLPQNDSERSFSNRSRL